MSKSKFKGLSYKIIHDGNTIPKDPNAVWFESAVCPQCSSGEKQEKNHRDGELTRTFICSNCHCVYEATVQGIKQPKEKQNKQSGKKKNPNSFLNKLIRGLNSEITNTLNFFMDSFLIGSIIFLLGFMLYGYISGFDTRIDLTDPIIAFLSTMAGISALSFLAAIIYGIVDTTVDDIKG